MDNTLFKAKLILSIIASFISSLLGDFDQPLSFLAFLILSDLITGFLKGVVTKSVESRRMWLGAVNKLVELWLVVLFAKLDLVCTSILGDSFFIFDHNIGIRNIAVFYFCIEEFVSVIENAAILGIPIPLWLRNILKQVNASINNSTPKPIIKFLNEKLSMSIDEYGRFVDKNKDDKTEENIEDNNMADSD